MILDFIVDLSFVEEGNHNLFIRALDSKGNWSNIYGPLPFTVGNDISSISPSSGGNIGEITATISGIGIDAGSDIYLESNAGLIQAKQVEIGTDQSSAVVVFDLEGQVEGIYDVVLVSPSAGQSKLENGFEIIPGEKPRLWVEYSWKKCLQAGQISNLLDYSRQQR